MKPRLKRYSDLHDSLWFCECDRYVGYGPTPAMAYQNWRKVRALLK